MKIFNYDAYVHQSALKDYSTQMKLTHPKHMTVPDSPYFGSPNKAITLGETIGSDGITRAGTFEYAMLQALDKVSSAQHHASKMQVESIINPDSVDAHDVSIAQAQAQMSLDMTRNILSRLVQSWRDLINTR